jgi:anti-sigma B factor antagonist
VTDPDELPALMISAGEPRPGLRVLRASGALDISTAPLLARSLTEHAADRAATLVLDLAGVRLLAAAGLALLVTSQRDLRGRLRVTGVRDNPAVERVLEITGTRDQLDIHDDLSGLLGGPGPEPTP